MTPSRRYRVLHRTEFHYSQAMTDGYTVACLVPRPTPRQDVLSSSIRVEPEASELDSHLDAFGNLVSVFGWHEPHDHLVVVSESELELRSLAAPSDDTPWDAVADLSRTGLHGEEAITVGSFTVPSPFVDVEQHSAALRRRFGEVFEPGIGIVDAARRLCTTIFRDFEFDPHFSEVSTPLAEVLDAGRGVCQDFAHLAVAALRDRGLPARYVSGYIETLPPPGEPKLVGADASHAWCSVWTPTNGWVDFDPTNGHLPVDDHITVAWGHDYGDVTPVRGVVIGPAARQTLTVSVDVARTD